MDIAERDAVWVRELVRVGGGNPAAVIERVLGCSRIDARRLVADVVGTTPTELTGAVRRMATR